MKVSESSGPRYTKCVQVLTCVVFLNLLINSVTPRKLPQRKSVLVVYKEVFVKEDAFKIRHNFEAGTQEDIIPRGFTHTFLIRTPDKYIPSVCKLNSEGASGQNMYIVFVTA